MVYVIRDGKLIKVDTPQAGDIPVYQLRQCSVRVQNPGDVSRGGDPNNPVKSTIPPQKFNHKVPQVDSTIYDYHNDKKRNIPLWCNGDYGLDYAGIRRPDSIDNMNPQLNLNTDDSLVSLIIPTVFRAHNGRRDIVRIHPSDKCRQAMANQGSGGGVISAYGLNGQIRSGDIWGFTVAAVRDAIKNNHGFIELLEDPGPGSPMILRGVIDLFSRSDLDRFLGTKYFLFARFQAISKNDSDSDDPDKPGPSKPKKRRS